MHIFKGFSPREPVKLSSKQTNTVVVVIFFGGGGVDTGTLLYSTVKVEQSFGSEA